MKYVQNSRVTEFAILLAVLLPITASRADNFSTAANQFFGIPPQSWNDAVWQPGSVSPTASNTYEVLSGGLIRNPTDSATETFPGDSLTLDAGSRFRATGWSAITVNFPGTGGNPGLILNGGRLQAASGASDQATTIAGQISVVADSTIDQGWRSRTFIFTAQISGSNNLTVINGSLQNPLDVQSANNPYTGNWFVSRGFLKGSGNGSLGTGNITIAYRASLEVGYDIQSPGALMLLGSNSVMILHQNCQFGAVTINGVTLTPGIYSYDALVALFPGNFAAGGSGGITIPASTTSPDDSMTTDDAKLDASVTDTTDGSDATDSAVSLSADLVTSLVTDAVAPTVPSGVIVLVNSQSQISISWNASTDSGGSGLAGYYVYRGSTMVGKSDGTSYVDTGLSPGTQYCYTIVAYDNDGNISSSSAVACATTTASGTANTLDTVAPAVSSAVMVAVDSSASSTQITISWNKSTDSGGSGLGGYRVYRNGTLVNTTTGTSYTDAGLSPNTQYCYTVAAYDNAGNTASVSAESCATTIAAADTSAPTVPNGVMVSATSSSQVTVSWNASTDSGGSGLAGYEVYRNGAYINAVTSPGYIDGGLSPNTQYCYAIMAYDNAGNISSRSAQACATTLSASTNASSANIVPPDRVVAWQGNVGVPGGIPNRATVYTTLSAGASVTQIQAALNACPSNQVVFLASGSYSLSDVLNIPSYVTLRGATNSAGAPTSILNFQSSADGWGLINLAKIAYPTSPSNVGTVTAGLTRGSTSITLASAPSGLQVDQMLAIDQLADNVSTYDHGDGEPVGGSTWGRNGTRVYMQFVKVTAINGNTVTFTPAIYGDYWTNSLLPQAYWWNKTDTIVWSGIENLAVNRVNGGGGTHNIAIGPAMSCWLKNVWSTQCAEAHFRTGWTLFCEISGCVSTLHDDVASGTYDVWASYSSGFKAENNVMYNTPCALGLFSTSGSVVGYNYATNFPYGQADWLPECMMTHGGHCYYNLFEGNYIPSFWADFIHGNASHNVYVRNRITGFETGKTDSTRCFNMDSNQFYEVAVGNIMGTVGWHNNYQSGNYFSIWNFQGSTNGLPTFVRAGNWNTVNAAIPASEALGSSTLSPSYYLTSKPSWFGACPWPPYDPGNPTSSSNTNIPAGYRYVYGVNP